MAKISNKKLKKEKKGIPYDTSVPLVHSILLCYHDLIKNMKILVEMRCVSFKENS